MPGEMKSVSGIRAGKQPSFHRGTAGILSFDSATDHAGSIYGEFTRQSFFDRPPSSIMDHMTIHPLVRNGEWFLGRDRMMVSGHTSFGQRDCKYEFDGYWTGDKWAKGRNKAISFRTEEDALAYIEGNYPKMDV